LRRIRRTPHAHVRWIFLCADRALRPDARHVLYLAMRLHADSTPPSSPFSIIHFASPARGSDLASLCQPPRLGPLPAEARPTRWRPSAEIASRQTTFGSKILRQVTASVAGTRRRAGIRAQRLRRQSTSSPSVSLKMRRAENPIQSLVQLLHPTPKDTIRRVANYSLGIDPKAPRPLCSCFRSSRIALSARI